MQHTIGGEFRRHILAARGSVVVRVQVPIKLAVTGVEGFTLPLAHVVPRAALELHCRLVGEAVIKHRRVGVRPQELVAGT